MDKPIGINSIEFLEDHNGAQEQALNQNQMI